MNITMKAGLKGRYKLTVRKADTLEIVRETPWFDNLILDAGIEQYGQGYISNYCQVGTSNVAPDVLQTTLVDFLASTSTTQSQGFYTEPAPNYKAVSAYTYRFLAGVATGNLSEVGVGWGVNDSLFSRALIVDEEGDPTTITVLADEVLDVTYELGVYLPLEDTEFDIEIGGVMRSCVLRTALIDSWHTNTAQIITWLLWPSSTSYGYTCDGLIGTILEQPTGTFAGVTGFPLPYEANSHFIDTIFEWGLDASNFPVESAMFISNSGQFQVSFSPPLAKEDSMVLQLTFRFIWGRYVP